MTIDRRTLSKMLIFSHNWFKADVSFKSCECMLLNNLNDLKSPQDEMTRAALTMRHKFSYKSVLQN